MLREREMTGSATRRTGARWLNGFAMLAIAVATWTFAVAPAVAQTPTSGLLYGIDFEDPPHKAGSQPTVGTGPAPRNVVSRINFGNPTVVNGFGALTSQVLKFDSTDGTGDQINLNLFDFAGGVPEPGLWVLEADVSIASITAGDQFRIFLDTPIIRRIEFGADGKVWALVPFVTVPGEEFGQVEIGTYTPGTKINVRVLVDLAADNWKIFLDGALSHDGGFGGATQIGAARFTTAVGTVTSGATAAIDNVSLSVAPALPPPPTSGILYDVTFNGDVIGAPPATHAPGAAAPRTAVAGVGGDPIVVAALGALNEQPLLFDSFDDVGQDLIRLAFNDFPGGTPAGGLFAYEADVEVASDPERDLTDVLQINIQGPDNAQLGVEFHSGGLLRVERVIGGIVETMANDTFAFDTKNRLRMEVDLFRQTYRVLVNGIQISADSFAVTEILRSFAHTQPRGMRAALDNILVTIGEAPAQFVRCPADDEQVAQIFADAGDAARDSYLLAYNPATTDGGLEDLSGAALCAGPSFPGDGSDPTVGFVRPCVPDQNDPDACFGPEGRDAFGGQFHHRVSVSGSLCTVHCYTIDGMRMCREVCVQQ